MSNSKTKSYPAHHRSGFNSGIFFGLVAGGALGYFLSTEKGKELLQGLKDLTEEKLEEIQESGAVQSKIQKAQKAVEEAKQAISKKPETPKSKKPRFFQKNGSPLNS